MKIFHVVELCPPPATPRFVHSVSLSGPYFNTPLCTPSWESPGYGPDVYSVSAKSNML